MEKVSKYRDCEIRWISIIEQKWFELGMEKNNNDLPKLLLAASAFCMKIRRRVVLLVRGSKNSALYSEYRKLIDVESKAIYDGQFG